MTRVSKSLADEIKEEEAASAAAANAKAAAARPEPPPDILVPSNCRRKIWPELDNNEDLNNGTFNDGFTEDWDMILETVPEQTHEAVDIVVRQQPSNDDEQTSFYRNARKMVVHQIQGI